MASQEISGVGTCVSQPVVVDWHWYYHAATAPLWALILLLLVIPKANRNRQAWLILIPLGLVLILWHTPTMLLGVSESSAQTIGCLIVSGAMAWTMVWLLGHRLESRYSTVTFFLILGIMLAAGALSFFYSGEEQNSFVPLAVFYSFAVVSLVVAMMLTGRFCRKRCSPRSFGLWLLVWLGAVTVGSAISIYLAWNMMAQQLWANFIQGLIVIPTMAALLAGIVYIVNLPFLILAVKNPFYRRRLEAMFRVRQNGRVALGQDEVSGNALQSGDTTTPGCSNAEPANHSEGPDA